MGQAQSCGPEAAEDITPTFGAEPWRKSAPSKLDKLKAQLSSYTSTLTPSAAIGACSTSSAKADVQPEGEDLASSAPESSQPETQPWEAPADDENNSLHTAGASEKEEEGQMAPAPQPESSPGDSNGKRGRKRGQATRVVELSSQAKSDEAQNAQGSWLPKFSAPQMPSMPSIPSIPSCTGPREKDVQLEGAADEDGSRDTERSCQPLKPFKSLKAPALPSCTGARKDGEAEEADGTNGAEDGIKDRTCNISRPKFPWSKKADESEGQGADESDSKSSWASRVSPHIPSCSASRKSHTIDISQNEESADGNAEQTDAQGQVAVESKGWRRNCTPSTFSVSSLTPSMPKMPSVPALPSAPQMPGCSGARKDTAPVEGAEDPEANVEKNETQGRKSLMERLKASTSCMPQTSGSVENGTANGWMDKVKGATSCSSARKDVGDTQGSNNTSDEAEQAESPEADGVKPSLLSRLTPKVPSCSGSRKADEIPAANDENVASEGSGVLKRIRDVATCSGPEGAELKEADGQKSEEGQEGDKPPGIISRIKDAASCTKAQGDVDDPSTLMILKDANQSASQSPGLLEKVRNAASCTAPRKETEGEELLDIPSADAKPSLVQTLSCSAPRKGAVPQPATPTGPVNAAIAEVVKRITEGTTGSVVAVTGEKLLEHDIQALMEALKPGWLLSPSASPSFIRVSKLYLGKDNISDFGATALAQHLKGRCQLSELRLHDNKISDTGVAALASSLHTNKCLTVLVLGHNTVGELGAASLGLMLRFNRTITDIDLSGNQIGNKGLKLLSDCLPANSGLRNLHVARNKIGVEGLRALCDALKGGCGLCRLNLGGNDLKPEGAEVIADALITKPLRLTHLHLGVTQLGDGGAITLASALPENRSLMALYLQGNEISDVGAQVVADSLRKNNTLVELHIDGNSLSRKGVEALAAASAAEPLVTRYLGEHTTLALAMALHPRLGADSPLLSLGEKWVREIIGMCASQVSRKLRVSAAT